MPPLCPPPPLNAALLSYSETFHKDYLYPETTTWLGPKSNLAIDFDLHTEANFLGPTCGHLSFTVPVSRLCIN